MLHTQTSVISGTGLFTPKESISNAELVDSFNAYVDQFNAAHASAIESGELDALTHSSVEFIEKASGIKSRYVMDKQGVLKTHIMKPQWPARTNEQHSIQCDMAIHAIKEALHNAGKTPQDVDTVIVACSNLARPYPAISIEIQTALGIEGFAYDLNVACSSATFGIQNAHNAIVSGASKCVVVVNPEICSAHLNWRDRDSHFIFGDACTAVVIESPETAKPDSGFDIIDIKLHTQFSNNIRNNFGFLNRCEYASELPPALEADKLFIQNGRRVFKDVCPLVAQLITEQAECHGLEAKRFKRLWLHQANINMNNLIAKRIFGRDASCEENPTILDTYANTSSAGSVIAFHLNQSGVTHGDYGVICSFGAGYSVGSVLIKKR